MSTTFMEAIARQEGFLVPGTIPNRNNNPGDIVWGKWAEAHGGTESGRYAKFATPEDGFAAMRDLLTENYLGLTVEAALNKWAPPVENETNIYITNVCQWTGMSADTVLTAENIG